MGRIEKKPNRLRTSLFKNPYGVPGGIHRGSSATLNEPNPEQEENNGFEQEDVPMEDAPTPVSNNDTVSNDSTIGTVLGGTPSLALIRHHDGGFSIIPKKQLNSSLYKDCDNQNKLNPPEHLDRVKELNKDGWLGDKYGTEVKYWHGSKEQANYIYKFGDEILRLSKTEYDRIKAKSKRDGMDAQTPPIVVERQPTPNPSSGENRSATPSTSAGPETRSVRFGAETSPAGERASSENISVTILGQWEKNHYAIITSIGDKQEFEIKEHNNIKDKRCNGKNKMSVDLKKKVENFHLSKDTFTEQWTLKDAAKYLSCEKPRYVVWLQPKLAGIPENGSRNDSEGIFINITAYTRLGGDRKNAMDLIKQKANSRSKSPTHTKTYGPGTVLPTTEIEQGATAAIERPENPIANQQIQSQSTAEPIALPWSGDYYIEARAPPPGASLNPSVGKQDNIWHLVRDENGDYRSILGSELAKQETNGNARFIDHDKGVKFNPESDKAWVVNNGKLDQDDIEVLGMAGYMVGHRPIATAIFRPREDKIIEGLRLHRQRRHGEIEKYEYDGPVRCSWTDFKKKTCGKDEALGILAKTDPALYAAMMERRSNSPYARLPSQSRPLSLSLSRSRSRSKTPGDIGSLKWEIDAILAKALAGVQFDISTLISNKLRGDGDSGIEDV